MSDRARCRREFAQLRELLPATGAGIYLDTATCGPLPAETAAAMREADDWELRVGRATEGRDEDVAQRRDEARAVLAALLGADPDEIALTGPMTGPPIEPLVDPLSGAVITPHEVLLLTHPRRWRHSNRRRFARGRDHLLRGDKWLLGPEGSGAIWSRRASGLDHRVRDHDIGRTGALGLARSVGWLEMYVGLGLDL